jgi:NitT/TauT family transport system substrate-binding protein
MSRFIRGSIALVVLLLVAACGGNGSASESGGLKLVRIGSQKITADAGLFLADRLGYFKQEGIRVTFNRLDDASAITNALATGRLEVAGATVTPGTFQATAQGLGIKIVGDKNFMAPPRGDLPAMSGTRLGVLPQYDKGNLKATLEALRGKKLAIHSDLSIQIVYLSMLLHKYGMSLDDFDITPVLSPDQPAALKNGAIQAAVMLEPYFSQSVERGIVKPVSDMTEELPAQGVSTTAVLYGKQFLQDKETAQGFMNAYMRGVRKYNDAMFYGKDKAHVIKIIAEETGLPADEIANTYPPGLDPNQQINLDWIQTCEDFYLKQGTLDVRVDPADMVDTSFRDQAIKKLGEYEPPKA